MSRLVLILKIAELLEGDAFNKFSIAFDNYVKAHYEPKNDGTTPNPWRRNMDYTGWENSPYYGNLNDFMKKFPGGIGEWKEWRKKTQKERNQYWDIKKRKAQLEALVKKAEIDFDDLTEEYEPTKDELEYAEQPATKEEKEKAFDLMAGNLDMLRELGVSEEEIKAWIEKNYGQAGMAADDKDLREELADLEHEQWAHWTKYMLANLTDEDKDRWKRQIDTDYKDLSEKEKDGDREWADKVLDILKKKNIKLAHYAPVGGDDVDKFEGEPHIYPNVEKFKDINEFVKKYRKHYDGQSADDMASSAVKDFINYWKLLLKGKRKRAGK